MSSCGYTEYYDQAKYNKPANANWTYPATGSQQWFRQFHPTSAESNMIPPTARLKVLPFRSKYDQTWSVTSPVAPYMYPRPEESAMNSLGVAVPPHCPAQQEVARRRGPQMYVADPWWPVNAIFSSTALCTTDRYCGSGDKNVYNLDQHYSGCHMNV